MNKFRFIILSTCCLLSLTIQAQKIKIKTGIEVLKEQNFKCLEGKRVGLITNPTGVDNHLKSTIDILHEAPNVNLVALYGPEHGVRGDVHAGDKVDNSADPSTGLPVYSLYGKTRKPTPEMLKDIDVLVYDIQDIGCRSFTYISTMGVAMEAAAENGKEFIVLDRPNPVGGEKVEGNLVEDKYISFVSQFKIPYLYGLTCGELALMLNGENMLGKRCDLHVVKMKGWKRKMDYVQIRLAMDSFLPPHSASTFSLLLSGIGHTRRTGLSVHRSRLYHSIPDVCRPMDKSRRTGRQAKSIATARYRFPSDTSQAVLFRRERRASARSTSAYYGLPESCTK